MATKVRIEFLSEGFQTLLNSPEVRGDIEARTNAIADAAGSGMKAVVINANWGGSPRPMGVVATDTLEAMEAEAVGNALSSAIDAGR